MAVFKICDYEDAEGMRCSSIALSAKKRLCSSHYIENLESQNKKLKEALRFYASGDAHASNDSWVEYYENGHIRFATGKRARAALKEVGANL